MGSRMEKDYLILKRASASRPSGEWNDDDFDVLADGAVVGRIFKANAARRVVDVDIHYAAPRRPCTNARLCRNAGSRDDGIRDKLATRVRRPECRSSSYMAGH